MFLDKKLRSKNEGKYGLPQGASEGEANPTGRGSSGTSTRARHVLFRTRAGKKKRPHQGARGVLVNLFSQKIPMKRSPRKNVAGLQDIRLGQKIAEARKAPP